MKKRFITLSIISALSFNCAVADEKMALLPSLLQCQPEFFAEIAKHENTLGKLAPIVKNGDYAHFQVSEKKEYTLFNSPIEISGLTVVGYSQSTPKLGPGRYFFWGLLIQNNAETIHRATSSVKWRKVSDTTWIAREEIILAPEKNLVWKNNLTAKFQSEPPKGSVEKILGLYKMKYLKDTYSLYCTIQGNIPDKLLKKERPDL